MRSIAVRVEPCLCLAAVISLASCALAVAADDSSRATDEAVRAYHEFQVCAAQTDDTRRLTCYDKAMQRPGSAPPTAGTSPGSAPEASAPPASPPPTPEQRFGLTPEQQLLRQHVAEAPKEMTSEVVAVGRARNGLLSLTLANGQVWTAQSASEPDLPIDVGDSVTVRRGLLGSFLLTASRGGKRQMRVDRAR